MCLRCTVAVWFRKNHKWTRGHSSQQDHAILWAYVKKHYSPSKSIRIYEFRCYKGDQATVSVDFGCREPSRNHEDEAPSTKFARLRITNWSTEYFTHQKSHYPIPELAMDLSAIAKLNPIPVVPMDKTNMGGVFHSLLLGSKQQNFQLAHWACQPAWAINLPM